MFACECRYSEDGGYAACLSVCFMCNDVQICKKYLGDKHV